MSREDNVGAFRYIPYIFNGHCAQLFQRLDHIGVVYDLVLDVHRGTVAGQRNLDDFNRSVHACTEAAGLCEEYSHT